MHTAALLKTGLFGIITCLGLSDSHAQVVINEVQASNNFTIADDDGDYEDWIELYNAGSSPVELQGYGLTDTPGSDPDILFRFAFPDTTIAPGEFIMIWASGKDRSRPGAALHTDFQISSEGEPLRLSDYNGNKVDTMPPAPIPSDYSRGRYPDGTGDWRLFEDPTPGESNRESSFAGLTPPPVFSRDPGFYTEPFELKITPDHPEDVIHYTLDGSEPTTDSPVFPDSILLDRRTGEENNLATIRPSPVLWQPPESAVFKGHVVRAIAVREGYRQSEVATGSWFVDPQGRDRYSFPVVSIVTDSVHLFSDETGIYVPGNTFDPDEVYSGNYYERGMEWERPAHLTLFDRSLLRFSPDPPESGADITAKSGDPDASGGNETLPDSFPDSARQQLQGDGFAQNVGLRIHGGATRRYPLKSLRVYARSNYDWNPEITYPLIPGNQKAGTGEPLHTYKRFILRPSGDDWAHTMFKDAMIQSLYSDRLVDQQAYRPAVVFINGEYWGIHNIRERYDGWYVETNYGIHRDDVAILTNGGSVNRGFPSDSLHYVQMRDYARKRDLSEPEHYAYIGTQMDIDNYLQYKAFQVYAANADWPHNNIRFWRKRTDGDRSDAPYGADGRWRWMIFDMDASFGYPYSGENAWWAQYDHDMLEWITGSGNPRMPYNWVNDLFVGLIGNETFRNSFISILAGDLNTRYTPDYIENQIDRFRKVYEPAMEEHIHRHPHSAGGSVSNWNEHIDRMREFAGKRPEHLRQHLMDHFDLPGTAKLEVRVEGTRAGHVRVNDVDIHPDTPGVAGDITRWDGIYFQGVPVTLTPVTDDHELFMGWETKDGEPLQFTDEPDVRLAEDGALQTLRWMPDKDLTLVAVFDGDNTTSADREEEELPGVIELGQNYPNPFNHQTNIPYHLGERARVVVDIHTVGGRSVKTIDKGVRQAGAHLLRLETTGMASGLYLYRLRIYPENGAPVVTRPAKMTLIR